MDLYEDFKITKIDQDDRFEFEDSIIKEFPLEVFVNDVELVTLICSPIYLKELAAGFLFSEGLIKEKEDIFLNEIKNNQIHVKINKKDLSLDKLPQQVITSGCGKSRIYTDLSGSGLKKVRSKLVIAPEFIFRGINRLRKISELFKRTGGVHNSLLLDQTSDFFLFREDIGRHNTIDKIAGNLFLNNITAETKILFTSGRITAEMILKTVRMQIPIIASPSAPTDIAIRLAYRLGVTLIGFVRGKRFNIYCHAERIK